MTPVTICLGHFIQLRERALYHADRAQTRADESDKLRMYAFAFLV